VYWANEAPSFWKQLPDRSGLHFCEVLPSMDTPEVGEIAREVQLVSDDCEASSLLQVKLCARYQVARSKEVLHSLTD